MPMLRQSSYWNSFSAWAHSEKPVCAAVLILVNVQMLAGRRALWYQDKIHCRLKVAIVVSEGYISIEFLFLENRQNVFSEKLKPEGGHVDCFH